MNVKKIGFIGMGVMGQPMCQHLLDAGQDLYIFTRTKVKAEELIKNGAKWCLNPKEVAEKCDILITIVGFPRDVEQVYFGSSGIFESLQKNQILIDMTTSKPSLAQKIADVAREKGAHALDAPVSGGDVGAQKGELAIMVGGEKEIFNEIFPILELLGQNINYMGPAGSGQHTKMSNQILIASTMIGVVESLLYAFKAGNDLIEVINVIGKGAASSWSINNLGRRIIQNNFDPGFFIKHFVKDMGIALAEAKRMNLSLPGLSLAYQFYISAMAQGLENLGTQGLYLVFAQMNGINF
jgi:3-hydroxyisobutyrate dehydrogenase